MIEDVPRRRAWRRSVADRDDVEHARAAISCAQTARNIGQPAAASASCSRRSITALE